MLSDSISAYPHACWVQILTMNSAAGKKSQKAGSRREWTRQSTPSMWAPVSTEENLFYSVTRLQWYLSCVENGPLLKSLNLTQVVYLHIHNENISVFIHVHALLENLLTEKLSEDVQSQIKSTSLEWFSGSFGCDSADVMGVLLPRQGFLFSSLYHLSLLLVCHCNCRIHKFINHLIEYTPFVV